MEIEGYCRDCLKGFDAHWLNYPKDYQSKAIVKPYCLLCGSFNVRITTDESNDPPEGFESPDDYDEIEEN